MATTGGLVDSTRLETMTNAMAHRGPDGSGIWISPDGAMGLGHRRLSIIDLSPQGAQPMHSSSGRYVISYNGEIYNFPDLRRELENLGATFRGHSDTEVILAACESWGPEAAVARLAGMFTIALWDTKDRELLLIRDRIGIKPLYYSTSNGELTFASELRPLIIWAGRLPPVSPQGLTEFLRLGYVPCPLSIFEGIHKLPPGTIVRCKNGSVSEPKPYWRYQDAVSNGIANSFESETEGLDALDAQLQSSVAGHMISDVPLGAFLSGGIDSSTVVALMQSQSNRPVQTFSIGFTESAYSEAKHAAAVARHLGTQHTEFTVTEDDAQQVIPLLPEICDEPFADVSQIPTYLVSKLAREHVTVALSGDGGDELFAGYNRYIFVSRFWDRLQKFPAPARRMIAAMLSYPSAASWDTLFGLAGRVMPASAVPTFPGRKAHKIASILPSRTLYELHVRLVSQWANPRAALREPWVSDNVLWDAHLVEDDRLSSALQQSVWDAQTYMVDDVLTKVDRATMSVGLEARVPLLDHKIAELAWRIPASMKLRASGGKWLLKQLLYRYVPKELVDRPKMGFDAPIDGWLRGSLREWAEDCLDPNRLRQQGYFDDRTILQTWNRHLSGKVDRGGPLWTVLVFQQWLDHAKKWV